MDTSYKSTEYAVQLLTYPPKTIVDLILGTLDTSVTECMEAMGKSLLSSSLVQDIPKEDIEKGLDLLKNRFIKKMEPVSGKLEKFLLDVVLNIPDHVLLPEDANQRSKHSTKTQKKLLKEIESVKLDICAEKFKTVLCKAKLKEMTETLDNLKLVSADIETTSHQIFRENKIPSINENSSFIKKNVNGLNSKLIILHDLLPQSKASDNDLSLYMDEEYIFQ